jgi:uncharacterized Ntn-hydrolase superfamily protein
MKRTLPLLLLAVLFALRGSAANAQSSAPIIDETGEEIIATFSIVARDPVTEELGVAVQSRAFRAAAIVSYAKSGVGAIATQASANQSYGPRGLELLEQGLSPDEVVTRLTNADEGRDRRQLAVIDAQGRVSAYTGSRTSDWAGHIEGNNYSVQGNILVSEQVVQAMAQAFETTEGELAERLMAALDAGQAAGGDARGKQSGGILVVKPIGNSGRTTDRWIDVRVDDHPTPFLEIRRLMNMSVSRNKTRLATQLASEGRFPDAIAAQRKAIAMRPGNDQYLYGLARLHARAGNTASAIEVLSQAIVMNERWQEQARSESDFESISSDRRFRRLIGR